MEPGSALSDLFAGFTRKSVEPQDHVDRVVREFCEEIEDSRTVLEGKEISGRELLQRLDNLGIALVGHKDPFYGVDYEGDGELPVYTENSERWKADSVGTFNDMVPYFRVPQSLNTANIPWILESLHDLTRIVDSNKKQEDGKDWNNMRWEDHVRSDIDRVLKSLSDNAPESFQKYIKNRVLPVIPENDILSARDHRGKPYKDENGEPVNVKSFYISYLEERYPDKPPLETDSAPS